MAQVYLSITSTAEPATDLGYLLHKHPARPQSLDLPFGRAHVFYPEATEQRCTAALLLEVDPIALVRGKGTGKKGSGAAGFALAHYINDRPYAASSMLAVALGRAFRTAMSGRCEARPELAAREIPLRVDIPALPDGGIPGLIERFFAPLGWAVHAPLLALDETTGWGPSPYAHTALTGTMRLADALTQLYVLLPALDGTKHYWVGETEVDKLLRVAERWLPGHPERELIASRYLARQRNLTQSALDRLAEVDDMARGDEMPVDTQMPCGDGIGAGTQMTCSDGAPARADSSAGSTLAEDRRSAVLAALRATGATRVIDMGCGEGALLRELLAEPAFGECVGADVSARALQRAEHRLGLDTMPERQRSRLRLLQSSVTYRDARLAGYDAMVLMEVIEHVDLDRLPSLARTVFGAAAPRTVVVTTPNADYNAAFPGLAAGGYRHPDHRFEFSRNDFTAWADEVSREFGYRAEISGVGPADDGLGSATQLAVFTRQVAA